MLQLALQPCLYQSSLQLLYSLPWDGKRGQRQLCAWAASGKAVCEVGPCLCRWNEAQDLADPIHAAHHRDILSISAEDPMQLVPGGVSCIKVRRITHSVRDCEFALGLHSMSYCLAHSSAHLDWHEDPAST